MLEDTNSLDGAYLIFFETNPDIKYLPHVVPWLLVLQSKSRRILFHENTTIQQYTMQMNGRERKMCIVTQNALIVTKAVTFRSIICCELAHFRQI